MSDRIDSDFQIRKRFGKINNRYNGWLPEPGHHDTFCRNKVRKCTLFISRDGDPFHGIGDVTIKPGKESESVFTRQTFALAGCCVWYRYASCFSAYILSLFFIHFYLKASLGKLVCSAHAGHTSSEDDYCFCHYIVGLSSVFLQGQFNNKA